LKYIGFKGIQLRRVKVEGHVARIKKMRNAYIRRLEERGQL